MGLNDDYAGSDDERYDGICALILKHSKQQRGRKGWLQNRLLPVGKKRQY